MHIHHLLIQVIELDLEQLPDGDEVLGILRQEHAQLSLWVNIAVSYILYISTYIYTQLHMCE